jgi:hypothetical protein
MNANKGQIEMFLYQNHDVKSALAINYQKAIKLAGDGYKGFEHCKVFEALYVLQQEVLRLNKLAAELLNS